MSEAEREALAAGLRTYGLDASSLRPLYRATDRGVYALNVPARDALARWRALRRRVPETGFWPVILGRPEHVAGTVEWLERHPSQQVPVLDSLIAAASVDPVLWLRERLGVLGTRFEPGFSDGEWPPAARTTRGRFGLNPITDPFGTPVPIVVMGLVPTTSGWEIPAHLDYANSANPAPLAAADHVRMFLRWYEQYGAEIVTLRYDRVIELHVARPPRRRAAALALAEEHIAYCSDSVGTALTLQEVAARLLGARMWHFWWD